MKIRCVDDLGMYILDVGGIYEGELKFDEYYKEKRWYLKGEKFRSFAFKEKAFEIVEEDKEMKFKVGDKVRVREDLMINEEYGNLILTDEMVSLKGKIVTIKKVFDNSYEIEEMAWFWNDEMFEEVKEEVKEKTFREVIADIKEGEIWVSSFRKIVKSNNNIIIEKIGGSESKDIIMSLDKTYTLQRKEYSFNEAFKVYEKAGKEVEDYEGNRYKKINGLDAYYDEFTEEWEVVEHLTLTFDEIRNPWYINN